MKPQRQLLEFTAVISSKKAAFYLNSQVLFHRFYCKKSFARFSVKRVAASCVWLASKLEESPKKARHVILVFNRMECRRENLPIEHFDNSSKKYAYLKQDLIKTERHLLKEMGFICHVEHPHKFISNYLATLETPPELRQEAWNLANDSLRTTLCVRFKSEVVACGVVYAAARRFQVPLPENPPWWKAFDADKSGIDEVCRVLAHLYSLPKAQYVPVCQEGDSFTTSSRNTDSSAHPITKEDSLNGEAVPNDKLDPDGSKDLKVKFALEKLKESKQSDDDTKSVPIDGEAREDPVLKSKADHKTEATGEKIKEKERGKEREKEKLKARDRDRGRDSERECDREMVERDRDKLKERSRRSKDKGKDSVGCLDDNHFEL